MAESLKTAALTCPAQLHGLQQTFVYLNGLPGRGWHKHLIYLPGLLAGFGIKTLPGVREAIEGNRFDEANRYAAVTATALCNCCDRLEKATSLQK